MASEESRAAMSRTRGEVAAGMSDQEAKKKFIARQGTEEAKGKQDLSGLSEEAFRQRNINVAGSFKNGTDYVPKTGIYKLHEGEKVIPKKQAGKPPIVSDPQQTFQKTLRQKADILEKSGDTSAKPSQFRAMASAQDQYEAHGPNGNMVRKGSSAIAPHDKGR